MLCDLTSRRGTKTQVKIASVINAKVPIIKCIESASNLSMDIALGASNGLSAVDFVNSRLRRCVWLVPRFSNIASHEPRSRTSHLCLGEKLPQARCLFAELSAR